MGFENRQIPVLNVISQESCRWKLYEHTSLFGYLMDAGRPVSTSRHQRLGITFCYDKQKARVEPAPQGRSLDRFGSSFVIIMPHFA